MMIVLTNMLFSSFYNDGMKEYKNGNKNEAMSLFEQSCESKKETIACFRIGQRFLLGDGIEKNYKNAEKLLRKSCDKGLFAACNYLGYIYGNGFTSKKDYKKALKYFKSSCEKANMDKACLNVVELYQKGFIKDNDKKEKQNYYLEKSCALNNYDSCRDRAYIYAQEKKFQKSLSLFEKSCYGQNDKLSCTMIAFLHFKERV